MPPHIVLVCKVVLAVTLCTSSGKLQLTPQQAIDVLTAGAPAALEVERTRSDTRPNMWHASTPYVRRDAAPAVTQTTIVNVTVNVTQPKSYLDELRDQGALIYHIPQPFNARHHR